ncbi:TAXI family TRAP transporter solute-binding subunit [Streptomyces kaniharaensis]|uniref:TAXI family TRAP transporter solute-binding subunit n=1 Tax=Streptomyces kaniharaensis TaxID=212423 RepID=A0A6N7KW67_9ACTN|nr:TAXI family TRAP transporter solute-binding subunit [Streptomyces kaniharaensis]MQS14244.1 TAXI family TRAP transporter solute-binding subunit [Streptomyces kaniharaensis]
MAPTTPPRLCAALRAAARSPLWRTVLVLVLLVAGLGGWWLSAGRSPGYPRGETRFATGVPRGVYDRYGQLLQTHVARSMPGVRLRLDNTQGSVDNLQRVAGGQDQFAIATADAVADYQGPGKDRLRAIARLYDDYLQLIVPASSPVNHTADLRGLRVDMGLPQSGVNLVTRRLLIAAGLDPEHDVKPSNLGIGEAADELRRGNLDAFFWSGGLPTSALTDLSDHLRIKVVPLGDLAEQLHKAEGGGTDAYRAATMPKGTYPNAEPRDAVATVAVPNLLITRDDVDPALVQGMTQAVIDSRDQIGAQVHAAQLVDLRTAVYTDPLPLHEGAMRYYRSVKP